MAQHDYNIANQSGAAFRADLNNALSAIVSQNSGATAPSTTFAYQFWADTTTGLLKIRNAANSAWITLRELDGTLTIENGTNAAPGLAFASDLDTGIYRVGADQLAISTGGTGRLFVDDSGRVMTNTATAITNAYAISTALSPALQIDGSTANNAALSITRHTAAASNLLLQRGVSGTPVADTEAVGQINFNGYDGTNYINAAQIRAVVDGAVGGDDMPGRLVFLTTADGASTSTEALRITSDKYLRMAASTGGIQFNGDTAAANALDDYEEGTWTPVISDGTNNATMSAVNQGRYTKIGNQVTCNCLISTSSLGSVSGNIRITGLPFANGNSYAAAACGWGNNLNITAGQSLGAWVALSATYVNITNWSATGGTANATATDWSADGEAMFFFSYLI